MRLMLAAIILLAAAAPASGQFYSTVVPDLDLRSPDGHANVAIHNGEEPFVTFSGHKYILKETQIGALPGGLDPRWSPDSRLLVVNASDGGWQGSWHALTYEIRNAAQPHFIDIEHILMPYIEHYAHCDAGELPNLQEVDWLRGGRQMVILASVIPSSECRNMGNYKAFILNTSSWKVVRIVPQKRVPKRWLANATGGV